MEYFEEIQDRVILIGVQADRGDDMEESLDENLRLRQVRRLQAGSFRIVRPYIREPISEKARSKR